MSNKVTYGLEKVHIAFRSADVGGEPAWETPEEVPGAVRYTPTAQGQESIFYADNSPYFVVTANNGYAAELEMANVPDAMKAEMLGWEIDTNGMLVELSDGVPKEFALLGQVLGDVRNRRFAKYSCLASRPEKEHNTKGETIEPKTDVLKLTVMPIEIDGRRIVQGDMELSDTNATAYNAFFGAVYKPVFGGGA